MEKTPEYYRLESFLDVIYSAVGGFLLYEYIINIKHLVPLHQIIVIFLFMYICDDYATMKIINSLKPYIGTTRWAIDVIMAFIIATAVYLFISRNSLFLFFFGLTYFLSIIWALLLKTERNLVKSCKEYLGFSIFYYCFSFITLFLPLVIAEIIFLFFKNINISVFFDLSVAIFIIVTFLNQAVLIRNKLNIIKKPYFSLKTTNDIIRNTSPFLSKWIIFLHLFIRINRKYKKLIINNFIKWDF